MRSRNVALVVLVLLAGGYFAIERYERSRAANPAAPTAASGASPSAAAPAHFPETEPAPPEKAAAPILPSPVDLGRADRDLDLHGRVVDAEGAPVAGARIECIERPGRRISIHDSDAMAEWMLDAETRSASDGTFSFRLERGDLRELRVTHSDYGVSTVSNCQAGERIEVVLHPGARIHVHAFDDDGAQLPGARVRLQHTSLAPTSFDAVWTTDHSGTVEIPGLEPGSYRLEFEHDRFGDPRFQDHHLSPGEVLPLEITFWSGRTISGTVYESATGAPIAGARVYEGWILGRSVQSDEKGGYRLEGIRTTDLVVEAEGCAQRKVPIPESISGPLDIALSPGDVAIGVVVDESRQPLAGLRVHVSSSVRGGLDVASTATADDGSFRVDTLHPERPHTLVLLAKGCGRVHLDFDRSLRRPDGVIDLGTIVLGPGRTIEGEFVDPDGNPLSRRLVAVTGHNADRMRLLRPGSGESSDGAVYESRHTDDLGRFRFPDLAIGEYWVRAYAGGSPPASEQVHLEAGAPGAAFVRLVSPAGHEFRVAVVTEDGDPVQGVKVQATPPDRARTHTQTTDEEGIASFRGDPGPLSVYAFPPHGFGGGGIDHVVDPQGQTETIVVTRAASISGIVLSPDGEPLEGMEVRLVEKSPEPGQWSMAGSKSSWIGGVFDFSRLRSGAEYDLVCLGVRKDITSESAAPETWVPLGGRIDGLVAPAERLRFTLSALDGDRRLVVRAIGPRGEPIEGARISIAIDGYSVSFDPATTDAGGVAALDRLPAVPLRIECDAPEPTEGAPRWVAPGRSVVTPAGQELILGFRVGAPVTGMVVDAAGALVDGAAVRARTSEGRIVKAAAPGGVFEIDLIDGETARLSAEVEESGRLLRGTLDGVVAGTREVRIVVRPE